MPPAKNLLLIPQRFAIGMQERGWWVRQEIVWSKAACMPESVRDRFTHSWEPIWMFAKSARYFFDQEAIREPLKQPTVKVPQGFGGHKRNGGTTYSGNPYDASQLGGANMRDVWHLAPEPSSLNHYAGFVTELPRRCILAGTSEKGACGQCGAPWVRIVEREVDNAGYPNGPGGRKHRENPDRRESRSPGTLAEVARWRSLTRGWAPSCAHDEPPVPQTVLDPFAGTFTTCLVADRLGRDAIGIELNPTYVEIGRKRIAEDAPLWSEPVLIEEAPSQMPLLEIG